MNERGKPHALGRPLTSVVKTPDLDQISIPRWPPPPTSTLWRSHHRPGMGVRPALAAWTCSRLVSRKVVTVPMCSRVEACAAGHAEARWRGQQLDGVGSLLFASLSLHIRGWRRVQRRLLSFAVLIFDTQKLRRNWTSMLEKKFTPRGFPAPGGAPLQYTSQQIEHPLVLLAKKSFTKSRAPLKQRPLVRQGKESGDSQQNLFFLL